MSHAGENENYTDRSQKIVKAIEIYQAKIM